MPRATLTKRAALGKRTDVYTANAADLTVTAASVASKNQFAASGKDLVIAHNRSVDTAYTITITNNELDSITAYSLGPGEYAVFGPFALAGWCQTDWMIYLEANNASVKFGVVDLSNF